MLSKEDNEFACRVGPGTPMGELFRRFWLPAMLSDELPGADCPPVRLRLLGEDLVAFRDSNGEIGVVEAHGLAVLTGLAACIVGARAPRYWHWHLALTHLLLGGANIAFFEVFETVGARGGGMAVTAIHFAFVALQAGAALFGRAGRES